MSQCEHVIYIGGVGNEPAEQKQLPELWKPYGLEVHPTPIDWTSSNYEDRLQSIGERIDQLTRVGRVSLVGASGGGKAVLSLLARHPEMVHRVVAISSKMSPYELAPDTEEKYPNLKISSNILPGDLDTIHLSMRERILCVHPLSDNVVNPRDAVLEGACELTVGAYDHIKGIRQALMVNGGHITTFIQQPITTV